MLEHGLKALAADVAVGVAVDRVADGHVVRRNRFGDRARGAAGAEEPPGHLLSGSDFGEGPVAFGVEIDFKRLLIRVQDFVGHNLEPVFRMNRFEASLNRSGNGSGDSRFINPAPPRSGPENPGLQTPGQNRK